MTSREICRGAEGGARQRWMRSEPGGAGVSQPAERSLAVVLESSSTEHIAPVQSGVVGLAALPKPGVCVLELQRSMEVCVGRVIKAHLVPPPATPQKMGGARATSTGNHLPPRVCLLVLILSLHTPQPAVLPVLPAALLGSSSQDLLCQPLLLQIHCKAAPELAKLHAGKHRRPCNAAFT